MPILRFIARFASLILTIVMILIASAFGFLMYQFYTAPAGAGWFNLGLIILAPMVVILLFIIGCFRWVAKRFGRKPEV